MPLCTSTPSGRLDCSGGMGHTWGALSLQATWQAKEHTGKAQGWGGGGRHGRQSLRGRTRLSNHLPESREGSRHPVQPAHSGTQAPQSPGTLAPSSSPASWRGPRGEARAGEGWRRGLGPREATPCCHTALPGSHALLPQACDRAVASRTHRCPGSRSKGLPVTKGKAAATR